MLLVQLLATRDSGRPFWTNCAVQAAPVLIRGAVVMTTACCPGAGMRSRQEAVSGQLCDANTADARSA